MNKKLILGFFGVVVGGSVVAVGTRAYFSQQGNVLSNTFSTGSLVLKLSDSDESNSDETTATWNIAAGGPGDEVSGTVNIKNAGNIVADHIEVDTVNTVIESATAPGSVKTTLLDTVLEITALTYDFGDEGVKDLLFLGYIDDENGNTIIDLDDLEATPLDGLLLQDRNIEHAFTMTIRFNPSLTVGEHQGDSATTALTVTLNQDASQ